MIKLFLTNNQIFLRVQAYEMENRMFNEILWLKEN